MEEKRKPGRPKAGPDHIPAPVMSVRIDPTTYDSFDRATRSKHLTISQGLRRLIRAVVEGRISF